MPVEQFVHTKLFVGNISFFLFAGERLMPNNYSSQGDNDNFLKSRNSANFESTCNSFRQKDDDSLAFVPSSPVLHNNIDSFVNEPPFRAHQNFNGSSEFITSSPVLHHGDNPSPLHQGHDPVEFIHHSPGSPLNNYESTRETPGKPNRNSENAHEF